ncbi:protein translocase subunit SecDF [Pseudofulvibacter geojedonensis]|uniref:Multifunctional fusion protein n=1 Tax=Pseudofulvibacter geojedonensis TaxID=1123758 RepID=A0ABW3I634_9FLAO
MQNKGLFKLLAFLFIAVSIYQLSFTFIADKVEDDAKAFAKANPVDGKTQDEVEFKYLDSVRNNPVFAGITYDHASKKALNKGLDLKGGVNVILQISTKDILKGLSNESKNPTFLKALELADEMQTNSDDTYLESFFKAFDQANEGITPTPLATPGLFVNRSLEGEVKVGMDDKDVQKVLERKLDESIESAFEVLRKRIDKFGVTQPNIQRLGNSARILIEMPGAKDVARIKKLVSGTAQLEFYQTHLANEVFQYLADANNKLKEAKKPTEEKEVAVDSTEVNQDENVDELLGGEDAEKEVNPLLDLIKIQPSMATIGIVKTADTSAVNSILKSTASLRKGELKYAKFAWSLPVSDKDRKDRYGLAETDVNDYVRLLALKSDKDRNPAMLGDVVTDARQDFTNAGEISVGVAMNATGAKQWYKVTDEVFKAKNTIAIVLDGIVYSDPMCSNGPIDGGQTSISGNFTITEAKDLANVLRAGKLPASADIISSAEIGPSLGQEAIDKGIMSFGIALLIVLIWMVFYYGKAGLYADIALLLNILLIFGFLTGLPGMVLTLPGIAGIVLTIGMSVDANVLIFERIREELAAGKTQLEAVKDGFSNALSSILDANVTTFLTALILFLFGTGPIQGFATTLMIGIGTSLFTAIFITRLLVDRDVENGGSLPFSTNVTKNWFKNMKVNFLGKRKMAYIISGVLIIASLGSIFTKGLNPGIDFSGGRTYQVRFDQSVNATEATDNLVKVLGSAEAKTFGGDDQLKISTKYRVAESGEAVDNDIQGKLYEVLKPYFAKEITLEQFMSGGDDKEYGILEAMKVGPTIADDIKKASYFAVIGSLLIVFLYILGRFKWWQFSAGAVAAVFHDVIIVLGIFSLTYNLMPFNMEIDQAFIAAILTVIGYSLNDTVVVFDRIREYYRNHEEWPFGKTVNSALNSTLSRTLNTSVTTLIVLVIIFALGSESIRGFIFALIIGVLVGTYSSLFIATPVMFDTVGKKELKREKVEEEEEELEVQEA